jgi:hypothetical protein
MDANRCHGLTEMVNTWMHPHFEPTWEAETCHEVSGPGSLTVEAAGCPAGIGEDLAEP